MNARNDPSDLDLARSIIPVISASSGIENPSSQLVIESVEVLWFSGCLDVAPSTPLAQSVSLVFIDPKKLLKRPNTTQITNLEIKQILNILKHPDVLTNQRVCESYI